MRKAFARHGGVLATIDIDESKMNEDAQYLDKPLWDGNYLTNLVTELLGG
jgi:hypothetical protein